MPTSSWKTMLIHYFERTGADSHVWAEDPYGRIGGRSSGPLWIQLINKCNIVLLMRFLPKDSSSSQESLREGMWVHMTPLGAMNSTAQNQGTKRGRESDWDWWCVLGNPLFKNQHIAYRKTKKKSTQKWSWEVVKTTQRPGVPGELVTTQEI